MSRHANVLTHCAEYCKSNPLSSAIGHVFLTSVPVNGCIYLDLGAVGELGNNSESSIYRISPSLLREASMSPQFLQFAMFCMTLSHRINRTRGEPGVNHNMKTMAERFYQYRGDAIRSLREFLEVESHCTADVAIAGIVSLLLADVSVAKHLT